MTALALKIPDVPTELPSAPVRSLVRACAASAIAIYDRARPEEVARREWSRDSLVPWLLRTPSSPATMAATPALVRTIMPNLITALAARSAAARIFREGLELNFDGAGKISVPTLLGNSAYATFVAESDGIPVQQGHVEPLVTLTPTKVAAIMVLSSEMVRSSNIEALVRDALIRSVGLALDAALLDDVAASSSRPAGLRFGVTPATASTAPDPVAALMSDIETLHRTVAPVSDTDPIFIASTTRSRIADLRSQHGLEPLKFFGSLALRGTMIMIAVAPNNIASAYGDAPVISAVSSEAALQMDSVPDGSPPTKSLWQTDSIAIMVKLPIAWAVRSSAGVAWMVTANW